MSSFKKLLITFLSLTLLGSVSAQEKKIYRWIDKNGKVQISDQLPPEAIDQARKEYSANSGTLKKDVQHQLSPTEQLLVDQQAQRQAEIMTQAEKAKRIEQSMLINYETEQDLQHAFDERTDLLLQTITSLQASIQSRRAAVINVLNELSDMELNGQSLPDKKIKLIKSNHVLVMRQSEQLTQLRTSFAALKSEFSQTMEKYRELKGITNNQTSPAIQQPAKQASTQ
jgi:hypothetical protein